MKKYFYYGFLIWIQFTYVNALNCFHCYGITHPRFCDHISTCTGYEACGIQRYTDLSGEVTYNLGCQKFDSCGQKRTGPTPTRNCIECCNKDLCNIEGCGELGHGNRTGHLCYNCKGILTSDECKHVKECFPNEACFIEEEKGFGESFFVSGCKNKHVCPDSISSHPIIGKRTTQELCNICCTDDLCNSQCRRNFLQTTQHTQAPTTESTPINDICLDTREDCHHLNKELNICESNNDGRRNACKSTCGYCEPMGHTFYLDFSPNVETAQLIFSSVRRGVCNLAILESSSHAQIILANASSIHSLSSVNYKMYKIECNILTKLYVLEIRSYGVDAYIAIPKRFLSTKYIIPSYSQGSNAGTYLAIISTEKNTEVQISEKGKSLTNVSLNMDKEWEHYKGDSIDISGSLIKASKPIAVYSNIEDASIGSTYAPFSDMVIPMRDYSKAFLVPNFKGITVKSVRIYANSTCSINVYDAKLNLLSAVALEISKRFVEVNNVNMASIVSSCSSMVQFYSHKASNQKDFMTLIPGIDKYLPHYYFTMPNYSSSMLIVIETASKSALTIDGKTVTPSTMSEIQAPMNFYKKYSMFTVSISQGRHEAKSTNGTSFGLWIYGTKDGFAFPAGYRISKT